LFLDSVSGLVIGLLDSEFNWVEYQSYNEKKPSEIIHFEIFNLLKKHNLKISEIRSFVTSGPGSYTGMRLSEGVAQVFELNKMPVFSFCHFEVPAFCGIKNGFWATNAFKGQVFIYQWDNDKTEKHLVNKDEFTISDKKIGFSLDLNDPQFDGLTSTKELIKNKPQEIFPKVIEKKLRSPPFYFRSLDEEFR
jgi:tRNA threonylcarbamoyladenosine biosynthesis protein TsaB